jgi:hypothetical protein
MLSPSAARRLLPSGVVRNCRLSDLITIAITTIKRSTITMADALYSLLFGSDIE